MTNQETVISFVLDDEQALALAQLVKRLTWTEFRSKAVDDEEAYSMRAAMDALQQALKDAGYSPR